MKTIYAALFSLLLLISPWSNAGISGASIEWLELPAGYELPSSATLNNLSRYFAERNNLPIVGGIDDTYAYMNLVSNGKFYTYSYNYRGGKVFHSLNEDQQTVVSGLAHNLKSIWSWILALVVTGTDVINDDNYQIRAKPALFNCSEPENCSMVVLSTGDFYRNSSSANLSSVERIIGQTDDFRFTHYSSMDWGYGAAKASRKNKLKADDDTCSTRGCDIIASSHGDNAPEILDQKASKRNIFSGYFAYHLVSRDDSDKDSFTIYQYDPDKPSNAPSSTIYKKDPLVRPFGINSFGKEIYFIYQGGGHLCMSSTPLNPDKMVAAPNHCNVPITGLLPKGIDVEALHLTHDDRFGVITCPSGHSDFHAPCYSYFYDGMDPINHTVTRIDDLLAKYSLVDEIDLGSDIYLEAIHQDSHDKTILRLSLVATSAKTGKQQAGILTIKAWVSR